MAEIFIPNTRDKLVMNEPFESAARSNIQIRATKDSESGGGSGCGNTKGYLDSYGTMMTTGSYTDCLQSLLTSGFLADGHGGEFGGRYPTKAEIGIFTSVIEDKEGLKLEWEYHDDPHSQVVRQKTEKRIANGKTCGLSIGFYVGDGKNPPSGWTYNPKEEQPDGIDYICVPPQYYSDVIPLYSALEYGKENLERAQQFWAVYILLRVHVYEVSQTEIPANEVSLIAEVRSNTRLNSNRTMTAEKREARAKASSDMRDAHEAMIKSLKKAKECREEHDEHMAKAEKHAKSLAKGFDAMDDDDDSKEDAPDKDEKKSKRTELGRSAFEGK